MGWYATALAEVRDPDGRWNLVSDDRLTHLLYEIFSVRCSEFCALLGFSVDCDVPVKPIAQRWGWPADTSDAARKTEQGQDVFETRQWIDGYSDPIWVTLRELLQNERVMTLRGEMISQLASWSEDQDAMRILLVTSQ
jgi:hypothetical protein